MCRNIRTLYNFEPETTPEEIRAAATQYVRKVSGMQKPSRANEAAFERAVETVAHATEHLLAELVTTAAPRDREVEAGGGGRGQLSGSEPRRPARCRSGIDRRRPRCPARSWC